MPARNGTGPARRGCGGMGRMRRRANRGFRECGCRGAGNGQAGKAALLNRAEALRMELEAVEKLLGGGAS